MYIPPSIFVGGLIGTLILVLISFVFTVICGIISHLISLGGIGAIGEEFTWSTVMKMTLMLSLIGAPIGFVIGALISVFGWVIIWLIIAAIVIYCIIWPIVVYHTTRLWPMAMNGLQRLRER